MAGAIMHLLNEEERVGGVFAGLLSFSLKLNAMRTGYMAKPLQEYFGEVTAADAYDYGHGKVA
jgi:hypothetical protein